MKITLRVFILLALGLSACLKTRTQLKDDEPATSKPQPVESRNEYAVDELKAEITRLNGRLDDLEKESRDRKQEAPEADEIKKLETRIGELERAQMDLLASVIKNQNAAKADPTSLFQKGKEQYQAGDFESSIKNLSDYLKVKNGKHVEEATYLRAESYYALGKYQNAIIDYEKFTREFKNSTYQVKSIYKIGRAFESLGMKTDADAFYQELIDSYPKTKEAQDAKKRLKISSNVKSGTKRN